MQNKYLSLEYRTKAVLAVILGILICFIYYLIIQAGVVSGADAGIDTRIEGWKQEEEAKVTTEGMILDRNSDPITAADMPDTPAECTYPEAYGALVGYRSKKYGTSGLRKRYEEELLSGGADGIGAAIRLTTDNGLQQFCYEQLGANVGSITVLDNKNGEILAMVSRSDETEGFDVNEIDASFEKYKEKNEFFYNRAVLAQDPPGSTWKMVTAAALLDCGRGDYIYEDTGEYEEIHNAGKAVYGTLNLQDALVKSCNTYFASAGNLLGSESLKEKAEKFLVGETIELDFTTLHSGFDLGNCQKKLVAQTAFGQGNTVISPLQIGMILQAVVNDGVMLRPYLIQSIEDDGRVIRKGRREELSRPMTPDTAKALKKMLHTAALHYDLAEEEYGIVYGKTGTAQVNAEGLCHIYLALATEQYTIVLSEDRSSHSSVSLAKAGGNIIKYLKQNE